MVRSSTPQPTSESSHWDETVTELGMRLESCIHSLSPNASFLRPSNNSNSSSSTVVVVVADDATTKSEIITEDSSDDHAEKNDVYQYLKYSDYDEARVGAYPANSRFAHGYPLLVVQVQSVRDVTASVRCAGDLGIPLSVMNGGHSFEGLSTTSPTTLDSPVGLLLHMDHFAEVISWREEQEQKKENNNNAGVAFLTIQAGMKLGRLQASILQKYPSGRFVLGTGDTRTVGVIGHVLCGGYGRLGRYTGMASDQLQSLKVVNASGEVIRASKKENPELFWALRGSCVGAAFGVVVQATFRLTPTPLLLQIQDRQDDTCLNMQTDNCTSSSDDVVVKGDTSSTSGTTMTSLDFPVLFGKSAVIPAIMWWQQYAPHAPPKMHCFFNLPPRHKEGHQGERGKIYCDFLGGIEEAKEATLKDLISGLGDIWNVDTIESVYQETDFAKGMLSFGTQGDQSLESALNTTSLPPLVERGFDCDSKGSSHLGYHALRRNEVKTLLDFVWSTSSSSNMNGAIIDRVFFKPYGRIPVEPDSIPGGPGTDGFPVWGGWSPLKRGYLFEMHCCKPTDLPLEQFVDAASTLAPMFVGRSSSPEYNRDDRHGGSASYIDFDILKAGAKSIAVAYYGRHNAIRLARLRSQFDPNNVFASRASSVLLSESTKEPDDYIMYDIMYVGGYPKNGQGGGGIYAFSYNSDSGSAYKLGLAAETKNPTFLAIHRNEDNGEKQQSFLYAVNEVTDYESGTNNNSSSGSVSAFSVDRDNNGKLTFLNSVSSGGGGPCAIAVNREGTHAVVANYNGGSVTALPIHKGNGSLKQASAFVQHSGASVCPKRQTGPHAHSVDFSPDQRFLVVNDLGLDQVKVYKWFDPKIGDGLLTLHNETSVMSGSGPRHLSFHPNGRFVYVLSELKSQITVFFFKRHYGILETIQTLSTLPADENEHGFDGENYPAEIVVHPSGRFLYTSNRGHDSITLFKVTPSTGMLEFVHNTPTGGRWPRHFEIDPTGEFLFVAAQKSNQIITFRIDQRKGRLFPTGQVLEVPSPTCIKFVKTGGH
eukprot:CAMPEP_0198306300 /NCGR_PEP_ID=MMETSP1449-20131203/58347_1 /TAXON_ID=420275 /ORGANISM="Attheya septentrionalis, Strain CCMP2084" /LENGTH=1043 /DNA_ID=CAMNT_0044008851 /DNA_START=132 /DNA_END=3260 /DNA_ORIENTATION=-